MAEQGQHRVQVSRTASFIYGLSVPLVRWQMAVELAQSQWPTMFAEPLPNAVALTNTFPQAVSGTVRCVLPERWRMMPKEIAFKLDAGEKASLPFEVLLPLDAATGKQEVRVDFDLIADRRYQFSVYRHVEIGDGKVFAEFSTRLDDAGQLLVEQTLTSQIDQPLSFKCSLYAPDRRRMIMQVPGLGGGTATKTYRIDDGKSLLGKTLWAHIEDASGQRVLNYRFIAQP